MKPDALPRAFPPGSRIGLDLGATLIKIAVLPDGAPVREFRGFVVAGDELPDLAERVADGPPAALAATGGGAARLASLLPSNRRPRLVDEFAAWGRGEAALSDGDAATSGDPHLLVSLGTGTSVLRVSQGAVTRAGGTAVGGGTLRGLGALLLGVDDPDALADLARRGDARRVDLLVGDLYAGGGIALMPDLTAANFGKLASRAPEDVAAALVRLVGETVALVAGGLAAALEARHARADVVFAGTTIPGQPLLREVLAATTRLVGCEPRFPARGAFLGAVGALASLESPSNRGSRRGLR